VKVIVKITVRDGYHKIKVERTIGTASNTVTMTIIYSFSFFNFRFSRYFWLQRNVDRGSRTDARTIQTCSTVLYCYADRTFAETVETILAILTGH
jgi:competence transcription factor ComK